MPVSREVTDGSGQALLENLRTFDPGQTRLTWNNRRWQILAGNEVLKDFGTNEAEARQALRLIQSLRLNQLGTVGSPVPILEYWLVNGQAPTGLGNSSVGYRSLTLEPTGLRVEQMQGQWWVRDNRRVLFNFGTQEPEARQALALLRKYQFSQLGILGRATPSMLVFTARPDAGTPSLPSTHPAAGAFGSAGRQLAVNRFPRAKSPPEVKDAKSPALPAPTGLVNAAVPPSAGTQQMMPVTPAVASGANLNQRPVPVGFWRKEPQMGATPQPQPNNETAVQRVPFDWRQVQLRQDNGEWRLTTGSLMLASFGGSDHDARLALNAIRHYRFTEQWRVGGEGAGLTYFTAGGQSPLGLMLGLNAQPLQPDGLAVQQVAGRYALCQGTKVVLTVGDRPEPAKQMLEAIQRHKFDRVCRLGNPEGPEGVTILVKSR